MLTHDTMHLHSSHLCLLSIVSLFFSMLPYLDGKLRFDSLGLIGSTVLSWPNTYEVHISSQLSLYQGCLAFSLGCL